MMNSVLTLTTNPLNFENEIQVLDFNVKEMVKAASKTHCTVRAYHCVCSQTSMGKYGAAIIRTDCTRTKGKM